MYLHKLPNKGVPKYVSQKLFNFITKDIAISPMLSASGPKTCISNVAVFDGEHKLPGRHDVTIIEDRTSDVLPHVRGGTGEFDMVHVDGSGCTLLPGLIDAHVHVFNALDGLHACVPAGVTTVMDMHNERDYATFMKEQCKGNPLLPEILSAFLGATIRDGWSRPIMKRSHATPEVLERIAKWPTLDTAVSVHDYVNESKALGADFIKLFQESGECLNFGEIAAPGEDLQGLIIKTAHEHELRAVAHATNLRETMLVLRAGADGLAHQFFDQPHTPELVELYQRQKAYLIPTLVAVNSFIGTHASSDFAKDDRVQSSVDDSAMQCLCGGMRTALEHCNAQWAYDSVRALKSAGVDIVCGTDSGVGFPGTAIGLSTHHELWMYVEKCGFTPEEAVQTASSVAARRYSLHDRGRVASGLRADLLLCRGDPTVDIRHSLDIEKVWRSGVLHPKYIK